MTATIKTTDPWLQRFHKSQLLAQHDGPAGTDSINTADKEIYGHPSHPILFRIGNGGAGYTGLLRLLSETYIGENGNDFRIAWVTNHSRHSEIALLADVVQIALLYEPENEDVAIREGWAKRIGRRAFTDHFILVGPDAEMRDDREVRGVLRGIANSNASKATEGRGRRFLTRGDGSATFTKEQRLFQQAGVEVAGQDWIITRPVAPYEALLVAEKEQASLLTDRATFLTAKRDGEIQSLRVHVQGGQDLLNPCSALVKSSSFSGAGEELPEQDLAARRFGYWLISDHAQKIIEEYGKDWPLRKPLFTAADSDEFALDDLL